MTSSRKYLWTVFLLLCVIPLYYFSYVQIFRNYTHAPPANLYLGFGEYPTDEIEDLGVMQQGYAGHWQRINHYSSTLPARPFLLKFEYLAVGHIGQLFHIWAPTMLRVFVLGTSLVFFIAVWNFIRSIFSTTIHRAFAWVMVLYATGLSGPGIGWTKIPFDSLVFERMTSTLPHYVLGSIFTLATMQYLAKALKSKEKSVQNFVLSCFFGMLMTHIFIPDALILMTALGIFWMLTAVKRTSLKELYHISLQLFAYGAVVCLPVLYFFYASRAFGWNTYANAEKLMPLQITPRNYLELIGPVAILVILSLPVVFSSKNILVQLAASWIIAHAVSVFLFPKILGVGQLRFFQGPYFIMYGVVAVFCCIRLSEYVRRIRGGVLQYIVLAVILIGIVVPSAQTYVLSATSQKMCFCTTSAFAFGYPSWESIDVFTWLENHGKPDEIVLTDVFSGAILPALTTKRVYMSWWFNLLYREDTDRLRPPVIKFYEGNMTQTEAIDFIRENHISYVYYGETERWHNPNAVNPPYVFLHQVYRSGSTAVYTVIQ